MSTMEQATTEALRPVMAIVDAVRQLEGGGFPVRRPFPTAQVSHVDPFLLIDEMGPVDWPPGEAIGAPDHPHRGFETVSYILRGRKEHKDSHGHQGVLGPGDVQWMTAGAGVVHSELPEEGFRREGGVMHGFQIWVNLPRRDKMMAPRYQGLPGDRIPEARSGDGRVHVKVIAGRSLGVEAAIETRTPIMYLHFTLQPGGSIDQPVPPEHTAMAYVFRGETRLGPAGERVADGRLALFGAGDTVRLAVPEDAAGPAELLLLTGVPLNEPVVRYGPFVMNSREEILQAFRDYEAGRMGRIPPDVTAP